MAVASGDGGDGVANVERLIRGEDVVAEFLEVHGAFAQVLDDVVGNGKVAGREDGEDAIDLLGLRGVDGDDPRVGVGAPKNAPVDQAREADVGAILSLTGDLLDAIRADRASS